MLSPSGHAQDTGRPLLDGFERGATRQLAEEVKKKLEKKLSARIILTHNAGEVITQEQKASFANRLNIDLYIALTIYNDDSLAINPYYYKNEAFNPVVNDRLTFYPTQKAYLQSAQKTAAIVQQDIFSKKYLTTFKINKPVGIPVKLLEGVTTSAFLFEISIKKIDDILTYVKPLTHAIRKIIDVIS
ncbi:MAG: hypothetical protein US13_C0008G0032 [candidate division TM6 bacterium GW2011_GWE2_36_25]|nr:MAG: hypothetical protein US03_C0008G0006 [candidate division TM6 bacterium GW2011_GWF2_36_131]KKQ02959.1 MAG: hypothetical protein US13_C0008G0032 [candidate division TM6 bacterium GW2011_GWE2_36_25]KKQ19672.1 MAG: hypothetical protein US32_C0006G0006 [candidate division TM6 bacterium GW2011_GWA2_36_9]